MKTIEELFIKEFEELKEEHKQLKLSYGLLETEIDDRDRALSIAKDLLKELKPEMSEYGYLFVGSKIVDESLKSKAFTLLEYLDIEVAGAKKE